MKLFKYFIRIFFFSVKNNNNKDEREIKKEGMEEEVRKSKEPQVS